MCHTLRRFNHGIDFHFLYIYSYQILQCMKAKLTEIEALKAIDESLENLTPEEKQRVFSFIASKHSLTPIKASVASTGNNGAGGSGNDRNENPVTDIKQFIKIKKPKGFYEQIACLGYFLENVQGLESFNTKQITKANTDARAPKIPNPSLYVTHSQSTYGFLSQVGGGKKAITPRGEALVEALPDREAVKAALEENPIKKKGVSKKKKQKNNS